MSESWSDDVESRSAAEPERGSRTPDDGRARTTAVAQESGRIREADDTPATEPNGPITSGVLLGGRYRLAERIGSGGMATIYRADDERLGRSVAVKVLHAHLADDAGLQARFRTEARHAAALLHPHIVNVYDQGVADLPYIVMEHVDGPSLRDVLAARERLEPPEMLAIVDPVCRALDRAHRAGVIHRDVKPENVLIDADGAPKVADFGIARVAAATSHTQTGSLIGSVHYLAPELVDGREASAASDQYALGVMAYELLTGEKPLPADSPMAVALRHARERIPAPSRRAPDCNNAVDAAVARATAPNPADRFRDCTAFAQALRAALPQGPRPVTVPVGASGDGEHTLVIPAYAQDTVVVGGGADDTAVVGASDAHEARAEEDRPPRRLLRRIAVWSGILVLLAALAAGGAYAYWHYAVAPITAAPGLVGMDRQSAFSEAEAARLGFIIESEHHDLDTAAGTVLEQHPPEGTQMRAGEDVAVVLSLGPQPVAMPELVGLEEQDAIDRMAQDHIETDPDHAHSDTVPIGEVIAQDPPPGETILQGGQASITVSLGIEQVEVPGVVGENRETAEALLDELDFVVETSTQWSDAVPQAGTVISQSREAGAEVDKGSLVELVVSRGPLTIQVPGVRGKTVEAATAELEALHLGVEVNGVARPRFGPFVRGELGIVEEQEPAPGADIQRGDTLTLHTYVDG